MLFFKIVLISRFREVRSCLIVHLAEYYLTHATVIYEKKNYIHYYYFSPVMFLSSISEKADHLECVELSW